MATEVASGGFAEYALLVEALRSLTVAQAKALIKDLNNEPEAVCGYIALSGNKIDLINRLIAALTERRNQGDIRGYQKFHALILRYKGPPIPAYRNGYVSMLYPIPLACRILPINRLTLTIIIPSA